MRTIESNHYSPGYDCDVCGKTWKARNNLRRHMKFCKKSHGIVEKDPSDLEIARFVDSKFGNHMLVDSKGHVYQVNTRNPKGTKIYWICRETGRDRKQKNQTLRFKVMRVGKVTLCNPLLQKSSQNHQSFIITRIRRFLYL